MKKLKADGVGIIFVTHFLEQVYEVCDRITVLRNGTLVGEYKTSELPRVQLVAKMMGKDFDDLADIKSAHQKDQNEKKIPMMGICLGHQLLALAHDFKTTKLKYGHRGANHPVKNLETGRTYISSQNHGYAVVGDSIDSKVARELFVNGNDGTNEGIRYLDYPAYSVQFHPEACGGPKDTDMLFDEFIKMMEV